MRIGVDLGGTKTEVVALDWAGAELARHRIATSRDGYDSVVRGIVDLVATVETQTGLRAPAIGIGIPGSLSPATGLVRNANYTVLNSRPLDRDLCDALGRPVRVENDANCFALAEAMSGAGQGLAQGADTVFGVILGTGVGGGIVTGGQVLSGRNLIAGEWGHNGLPVASADELSGPPCYCGRCGCIETWCSGPAMRADHERTTGQQLNPSAIAARAAEGDAAAMATLDRHLDRLARALAVVVNILDPDAIVLGGGLSNLDHLYARLPGAMRPHVISDVFETPILKNRLGDSAGVIGAAWLWPATGQPGQPVQPERAR
jgi:fructokinase